MEEEGEERMKLEAVRLHVSRHLFISVHSVTLFLLCSDERTMAELDLQRRQMSDYRHQLGDAINSVELQTVGRLSEDYATLADNKAAVSSHGSSKCVQP